MLPLLHGHPLHAHAHNLPLRQLALLLNLPLHTRLLLQPQAAPSRNLSLAGHLAKKHYLLAINAAAKQTKPLTRGAKKLTCAELLPYQHGRLPFEGLFNELVDKVSSALTPKNTC